VGIDRVTPDEDGPARAGIGAGAIASMSGAGLLGVFMAQNTEQVEVSFLGWDFMWPVWLLTLGAALLGALVWFGAGVVRRQRRRRARRAERRD
jgi:uncharacterized integral membrane protein